MARAKFFFWLSIVPLFAFSSGCTDGPAAPELATVADSLAWRIAEARGGLSAWESLPMLRFDYLETMPPDSERVRYLFLWDRRNDRLRVEWIQAMPVGPDSTRDSYRVVLLRPSTFDPGAPRGSAMERGRRLQGSELHAALETAYAAFDHGTAVLAAPFKLFDPGVTRSIVAVPAAADRTALRVAPGNEAGSFILYTNQRGHVLADSGLTGSGTFTWSDPAVVRVRSDSLIFLTTRKQRSGFEVRTPVAQPGDAGALLTDLSNRLLPLDAQ